MTWSALKRFYDDVSTRALDDGHAVALDGRTAKTPAGHPLVLPDRRLAEAVAAEWAAQEDEIHPPDMPLTQLVGTAIDRVASDRGGVVDAIVDYAGTDLLCYRAASPIELRRRQDDAWQPLLDWAARRHGARLDVTAGIVAVAQPQAAVEAVRQAVEGYDDLRLAALASATAACGSVILALALAAGEIDAATAFELSHLDETYQVERWGEDAEATTRRRLVSADIDAAASVLAILAEEGG